MSETDLLKHLVRWKETDGETDRISSIFGELREMQVRLEHLIVPELLPQAAAISDDLDGFRVRASLIGQVKAGKTALSNSVLGLQDMLPSDVNPWTSVVTSIHVNQSTQRNKKAVFKFFDKDDWSGMMKAGGRIAEMAEEADLDTELEELRAQIKEMQERTTARLGRNFELLLGGQHAFSEFDKDLIKRYVCMGEDDGGESKDGRFADLTKSADLYLENDNFGYPITISDTPGVNDPFLVREAVTLDALGKADICVIVLSAHQALSTADLALMRILINLNHEQIILFVNRIDELANPHTQIQEIERHIRTTLSEQNLPSSIPVVFGSAAWGEAQIAGTTDVLNEDSIASLAGMIEARKGTAPDESNMSGDLDLSGMSALQDALDRKVTENVCAPFARDIAARFAAIAQQSRSIIAKTQQKQAPKPVPTKQINVKEVETKVEKFLTQVDDKLEQIRTETNEKMKFEISSIFNGFIFQEGRQLVAYMDGSGQMSDWAPDAEGLRRGLNKAYTETAGEMRHTIEGIYGRTHKIFETIYADMSGDDPSNIGLAVPTMPAASTPVSLMRTMSIDFSSSWIANWITKKLNRESYMKKFQSATVAQMHTTLGEIQNTHIDAFCDASRAKLHEFVEMHMSTVRSHARLDSADDLAELRRRLGTADAIDARVSELNDHISEFEHIASWLVREAEDTKKIA